MSKTTKTILITGASSGLGMALAIEYANESTLLILIGRNKNNLDNVALNCQQKGSKTIIELADVRDNSKMLNLYNKINKNYNIDLVIANAGISAGTLGGPESDRQVREIFTTNIDGVLNTINPAIDKMRQQGYGQIAIISSLAGFRGLPSSPAYSASKAAVRIYGEALRGSLKKINIKVNVICPGYIRTPMTDINNFPMPFIMNSDKAAKIIKNKISQNKGRIAFPFLLYFLVWLLSLISIKITDPIFEKLPGKKTLKS
jgi:short-subunit dehydrogenase